MNITFMIGNGFDLNLGLETRYTDFYKYYKKNDPCDMLSKSISQDYEMWADLEMGLGEFLKDIDESQIDEFLDSKSTLEKLLSEYLKLENQRVDIKAPKALGEEFKKKVLNFYSDFSAEEKDHYHQVMSNIQEIINYSFITYNYTSVLDDIVATIEDPKHFYVHRIGTTTYQDTIVNPHHIHGMLNEDLILGLDNIDQIKNDILKSNTNLTNYIIKSFVNKALGQKKIEIAKGIIDKSRYICLFGLSIGDTDSIWWSYLIKWLNTHTDNRLVIFVNENSNVSLSGQEKLRFRDKKRNYLFEKGLCVDQKLIDTVCNKIIIVPNSEIFNFKNIIVNEKDEDTFDRQ